MSSWRTFGALVALALCALASPVVAAAPSSRVPLLDALVSPRQPGSMAPRDECAGVPGARAFRVALARAVSARDVGALAALTVPDVKMGFGGDDGIAALRRAARDPKGTFWPDVAEAIRLGCDHGSDGALTMPWIFAQDRGNGVDAFDAMLVMGTGVALRAAPSRSARAVRRLDWQFVELVGPGNDSDPFLKVRTRDKAEGYVARPLLRSLVATRVIAERIRGRWKVTAILAGD